MRQITIRNIDDRVYERLKGRARASHRSIEAEVRAILGHAAIPDKQEFARRAASVRASIGRFEGNVTALIREDRDR